MIKNICVFASSSQNLDSIYYTDAAKVGKLIGGYGMNIVYGGSRLGLMYACANEVKNNGGDIIGIMPESLYNMGYGNPDDCADFVITKGMRERKAKMDEMSDAVIALAGGFGTLEEISEMIVQKQLGYNKKPIVFLNTDGFYDNLIQFFENIIYKRFAKNETGKLYYVANTPEESVNYILNYDNNVHIYSGKF